MKTPLSTIIREESLRALVFGLSFFMILTAGFVGIANAANGGVFGNILNRMLASGDWTNPGADPVTVKNALKLGNQDASNFVPLNANPALRSCGAGQCIFGFNPDGSVKCQ